MVIQQNSRKLLMMDIKSELKRSWSIDCSFSYFASIGLNFCEPHLAVGTQLTRSELKTILLTCFNSIMNSDGGNLMICAYFLHPNILYLTLIILIMKTKECHWDTAFVSCIGSPMNNREPCGRARVLGQARDRERERERVRWGLDWSQSNVRHHYQHQSTNHHHHQPITKILITKKESHETLASLKIRRVVYMEGLSCCYWLADRSLWLFFF